MLDITNITNYKYQLWTTRKDTRRRQRTSDKKENEDDKENVLKEQINWWYLFLKKTSKEVDFSDFISTFAMSIVGFSCLFFATLR